MFFAEIFSRAKLTSILIVIACLVSAISKKVKVKHGPSGMSFSDSTNCSDFSKFGRFNPLSVLREKWFVFYYWGPVIGYTTYIFTFPSANHTKHLKKLLNGNVVLPVMWSARQILMEDNRHHISLLVERSDRGEYWLYPVAKVQKTHKITPRDIRMKQTGDNRLIGLMDCIEQSLLVMARLNDVPRKDRLVEEAMRLGYRGRKGKSYLYQGHEWGPIPEANEEVYWDYRHKHLEDTPTEDKSSEGSSEEVESQLTNKEESDSKGKKTKTRESKAFPPAIADVDNEMCVKVEPELWNDPKPNLNPDNSLITKEELDNLDFMSDTNNTLTIETSDELPNNKQEKILDKESEKTQENDILANQKDVPEIKVAGNEQNNIELHTENTEPEEDENCVVCYKSQVSYVYTDEPYRPVSSSISNLKKNEEVPHTEVPRTEVPLAEVPRKEVPLAKLPRTEVPLAEVPHTGVPLAEVPRTEVPFTEVPRTGVPLAEVPSVKISRDKVPSRPTTPPHDLVNSSEIIILMPKTLDDLDS